MLIRVYIDAASSFHVFQIGFTADKHATNGYDPAIRLEDGLTTASFIHTLRRASILNSDLQSLMFFLRTVLRSPEHALAPGETRYLLLSLLYGVITY